MDLAYFLKRQLIDFCFESSLYMISDELILHITTSCNTVKQENLGKQITCQLMPHPAVLQK